MAALTATSSVRAVTHDHGHVRVLVADVLEDFQAVHPGHVDVEQD